MDFEVTRGQKVCLVGPNGAGKSTLLKMMAQVLTPDGGNIKYGYKVEPGYFSQTRTDVLNPERSVFDEVISAAPQGTQAVAARSMLGLFNFHGDDVFKPVKVLSGGEKSRLILAKLLINPPNFMLLDEPTTHLDLDGIKALTNAFKQYSGTLLFISHDLYFIKQIANCIVDVQQGRLRVYLGGLDYYLEKTGQKVLSAGSLVKDRGPDALEQKQNKKSAKDNLRNGEKDSVEPSANDIVDKLKEQHKKALKRIEQIKAEIKKLEAEQKELEMESYVKARHLSKSYDKRDEEILKEFGRRLKWIQGRLREIESTIKNLTEEKNSITK